jgi:prephenate dehydrogenase
LPDTDFSKLKITIVGLGVIGGSFAKGLKDVEKDKLYGVDIDENTLITAIGEGIIDEGFTDPCIPLKESDIVILCIYPKQIKDFIIKYKDSFKAGVIITDTAGIKQGYIEKINPILPDNADFIFGHPMAGREKKGIDFSSGEVFKGANYLIIPNERNKEENINKIEDMVYAIGFKSVSKISAKRHDELISYTSQLPHAIAVSLINSDEWEEDMGLFIGDSYKELTRIASINESLWSQLFIGNRENLIHQINLFEKKLNKLKRCLIEKDEENLIKLFKESSKRREKI